MSSHLDTARRELMAQRRLLSTDISQLTRQLKKIDQALEHLAPINNVSRKSKTQTMPKAAEMVRRKDTIDTYLSNKVSGHEFDITRFLDEQVEPVTLSAAYRYLLLNDPRLDAYKGVGSRSYTYRVK